jgi:enoyl-CoA hydratase/carnithine racemase
MTILSSYIDIKYENGVAFITLNRQEALNALNPEMAHTLITLLTTCQEEPSISCIVLQSALPKAFCAGGDIKKIYALIQENNLNAAKRFHAAEYQVCTLLKQSKKPVIALGTSLVMGGGLGLVMHSQYRIATSSSLWAMPETEIGLFPDVGAAHFLNRCPHFTGYLMALTGYRAPAADLIYTGLATHYLEEQTLPLFIQGLKQAPLNENPRFAIETLLEHLSRVPDEESAFEHFSNKISECFSHKTMVHIISALEAWAKQAFTTIEKKWVQSLLQSLEKASPLSLCVTLSYLHHVKTKSLYEIHQMDQILGEKFFKYGDYMEGVRAKLIDKCKAPNWLHPSVETVTQEEINSFLNKKV